MCLCVGVKCWGNTQIVMLLNTTHPHIGVEPITQHALSFANILFPPTPDKVKKPLYRLIKCSTLLSFDPRL